MNKTVITSAKGILLYSISTALICVIVNIILMLVLVKNWGVNQDITPDDLSRVRSGMSMDEVAYSLGVYVREANSSGSTRRVNIAMPGIGKFFVTQHRIDLDFDSSDRLVEVHVERAYQTDERMVDVALH